MSDRVLVSTHDLETAGTLREAFAGAGYDVELVTPAEVITDQANAVLLVLTGWGTEGEPPELLGQARDKLSLPVLAVVRSAGPGMRARALDSAVSDVFVHPIDPEEVLLYGRRIIDRVHLQEATGIVGETDAIREALERVVQIAPVDSTVLVTGESGTGKELVARGIHALSKRKHQRFIAVNVAALPDTLLESELFGHEKGAFTGAIDSRKGFFELADKGVIFLDEIGDMPLATQTKMLRVLEQREFTWVGGEESIRVDVRIITATNRDLRELAERGEFRRDLYYRLNVLSIQLPPLRERAADIPLLVHAFIREVSERHDRPFVGISTEAMRILEAYHWPGNVRELRNLIESMVVLAPGQVIRAEDIPDEVRYRSTLPARVASIPPLQLPASAASAALVAAPATHRPELEFIFKTLVDLRVDMDELRRQFEAYQRASQFESPAVGSEIRYSDEAEDAPLHVVGSSGPGGGEGPEPPPDADGRSVPEAPDAPEAPEAPTLVIPEDMTIEELERLAIESALRHTGGNRRKAAERLGIGERTLYRKIQKFGLAES